MKTYSLLDTNQSLTLTSTSNAMAIDVTRNGTLQTIKAVPLAFLAIITTLISGTAPVLGIYSGPTGTATNIIGRIRFNSSYFAVGNIVGAERPDNASYTGYGAGDEAQAGGAYTGSDFNVKVDTASSAGVAKIIAAVEIPEE